MATGCGVGCRDSSDLALLWLWWRPAVTAPIRPLVWELPYAAGMAPKRPQRGDGESGFRNPEWCSPVVKSTVFGARKINEEIV